MTEFGPQSKAQAQQSLPLDLSTKKLFLSSHANPDQQWLIYWNSSIQPIISGCKKMSENTLKGKKMQREESERASVTGMLELKPSKPETVN